jgi:signal transduction histidine kinase
MNARSTAADKVGSPSTRRLRPHVGRAPVRSRPGTNAALIAGAGLAGAVLIGATPALRFAYPAGLSGTATQTAVAVIALLALSLLVGRSQTTSSWAHPYLCSAVALLAASAVARMLARADTGLALWWAIYASALAGVVLLVLSAWAPPRGGDGRATVATVSLAVLGLAVAAVHTLVEAPVPLADMRLLDAEEPHLDRQAGMLVIHLGCALLFALASAGFARRAAATRESLAGWLAAAAACEAVSRLYLLLFPPVPSGWLHSADVWHLGFALLLLVGLGRWARQSLVTDERRRIAHAFHDGVAQELAFIRRHAEELMGRPGDAVDSAILAAAQRADEEARRAVALLAQPPAGPLVQEIERVATQVAEREGVALELALAPPAETHSDVSEPLARITGEAVTNAARHGRARTVRVELRSGHPLHLSIADDGVGFDPATATQHGYGLVSMRERAEEIGARLALVSDREAGTEVRVELP